MRFLGIGFVNHDTNITLYDEGKLSYFKYERNTQVKHQRVYLHRILQDVENIFGYKLEEYDAIASSYIGHAREEIVTHTPLPENDNCWQIDHHRLHYYSGLTLGGLDSDISIVIDGVGNEHSWSIHNKEGIIHRFRHENGSVGNTLEKMSEWMQIPAQYPIDVAGKFMGMQSYGTVDEGFLQYLRETNNPFEYFANIGDPINWVMHHRNNTIKQHQMLDYAATVHRALGDIVHTLFEAFAKPTDKIIYTGGAAQNVLWNSELIKRFPNTIIPPYSTDEGLSIGAVNFLCEKYDAPLGVFDNFPYSQVDVSVEEPSDATIDAAAKALAEGKVVAWYQGHGEIGPRALGNRSILMDPRLPNGKDVINEVKNREQYRPFGATVLIEHADSVLEEWTQDKYMLFSSIIKDGYPAITHVDKTCRCQTLENENPVFRKLLERFYQYTGCPVLLNTSLNVAGDPIAGSPADATYLFSTKETLDMLVIGDTVHKK